MKDKPKIFTLLLYLTTLTFTLLFGHRLLLGRHTAFSQNPSEDHAVI
jgi:hypothetical protein